MEDKTGVILFLIGVLVGAVVITAMNSTTGMIYRISTPITDLQDGRIYEVKGIYREETNCFMWLKADGETTIKYYNLTPANVPAEVTSGDRIAKLSSGIAIIP